ncbi:virulence factor TspB C-terminal domain-related protein [Pseudomonas amygdali pv. lachrymans]|uniref:virulence factor TspB C-terminal domain-related protein n=1 Tax=Pseudomonas amygdali TaxID=47877 RepID=UPI0006CCA71B|nr:virulence factor TspB C-terminal domain-related protein [Pseudomonas amygdali]KPB97806.1 putative coat protein A [Pseudomonas amygdali pv. lachrymans]RMM43363.1 hypothetical protein ALQ79_200032 [Pseudomonas amygdali pv. lachrymans]WIO60606.1 virulence factor TspB C-terminal domain-related protein [Pseudomonas amygdali pv. lachrymans]WIO60614.1 virulence factor TspB C-terminal domain-related protein [Pseudomonas amygdali pv. lachrymans]WIO60622.1 virulence factor TspB C-terminal domain-rela
MMINSRYLPFLLLLFSSFVFSENYHWLNGTTPGAKYSSISSACGVFSTYGGNPVSDPSVSANAEYDYGCYGYTVYSDGSRMQVYLGHVTRGGDSCPSGTKYNKVTGACDKNDCLETLGTTSISLSSASKQTGGVIPVNNKMCNNSCQFVYTSGGSATCGPLKANPDSYYCIFNYTGNGQSCDGSEESANSGAPATSVPPKDPTDPTDPANNCGKGYAWSGSTCVKYWEDEKDSGSTTPKPPTGGGSTGGGGGSSGGGGAGGGTGTGDAPAPGTENNGGGGAGEGKDDDKDIEASSSQDCKKPPACDGDVFSCAILNQSYFDSCRLISLPTEKEKIGRDKEIDIQQDLVQESQDQLDSQVSGFLSKFMSAGTGNYGGGKCYPDKQFSIGGQTLQLPFSQICDPLVILRYGLIAAAYLAAARILSKEV